MSGSFRSQHVKGLAITALGGLTLTVDIPLIRLADGAPWSILMARSGITFAVAIGVWLVWRGLKRNPPPLIPGRVGVAVAALYSLSSVTFITAVYSTSTANLVFILAFNTMFAALLSWAFLGERPRPATFIAMGFMLLGVLIIVREGIASGHIFGDAMALASAISIAAAITISRSSGKNMGFSALVAVIVPFVVAAFMVAKAGIRITDPLWIVIDGAIVTPVSFFCLANGPRYLTAPEVAMFYLLETVLAPIWVWIIFADTPSRQSLIGGTILIVALVAHSLWFLFRDGKRGTETDIEYPI